MMASCEVLETKILGTTLESGGEPPDLLFCHMLPHESCRSGESLVADFDVPSPTGELSRSSRVSLSSPYLHLRGLIGAKSVMRSWFASIDFNSPLLDLRSTESILSSLILKLAIASLLGLIKSTSCLGDGDVLGSAAEGVRGQLSKSDFRRVL